jgi:hypothetical protein
MMTPGQALSLDEMMIASRARISWKVRVPSKPIKDGIKVRAPLLPYCVPLRARAMPRVLTVLYPRLSLFRLSQVFALCDPAGYCFDFLLQSWGSADRKRFGAAFKRTYPHLVSTAAMCLHMVLRSVKVSQRVLGFGLVLPCLRTDVCVTPLSVRALQRTGHIIVTDRYFTSVKLLRALRAAGHHLVGTLKAGRGVAKELLWARGKKMLRWSAVFRRSFDLSMLLQSWQDRGHVHV